jgi:hypothetical protein
VSVNVAFGARADAAVERHPEPAGASELLVEDPITCGVSLDSPRKPLGLESPP